MGPSSGAPRPDAESLTDAAQEAAQSEAPAVMATPHMARFEFSDAGTKILMVEWLPGDGGSAADADVAAAAADAGGGPASSGPASKTAASAGASATDADTPWQVSWPGKSTFLPARDVEASVANGPAKDKDGADTDSVGEAQTRRRVYFLLPPDAPVPATVTITPPGQASIEVKPLPAIFPESFLDAESATGSRGVLHTIWAKKRLSELEREMEAELRANAESVGVEMALAEKQWIIDNFLRPPAQLVASPNTVTPATPRSPITGRLGEKLKGLRLATSPSDLIPSPTANTFTSAGSQSHTLSPQGGDIAVSSFSSIPRSADSKGSAAAIRALPRSAAPIDPAAATVSLNAAVKGEPIPPSALAQQEHDEDLFVLPISPRSPEMKKSPFSIL